VKSISEPSRGAPVGLPCMGWGGHELLSAVWPQEEEARQEARQEAKLSRPCLRGMEHQSYHPGFKPERRPFEARSKSGSGFGKWSLPVLRMTVSALSDDSASQP